MTTPALAFDRVWKKFKRGEPFDSLRDLLPHVAKELFSRNHRQQLRSKEFWALRDVSFTVQPGEALGIIGPNGAGKSTILKLLSRILRPTDGGIRVRGQLSALLEVGAGFHPDLTGRENTYLNGAILGMKKVEIDHYFDEIVEFADLHDFIDTPVKRYSSGMYARLGFSIAAHLHPDILLVDEVLSVGDLSFQVRCFDKMREKLAAGVALVFVSHNLQAIAATCSRCLVIGTGEVRFDGPTEKAFPVYLAEAQRSSSRYGTTNPTLRLLKVQFATAQGQPAHTLPPHTRCELRAIFQCLVDTPPFSVGIEIERTRDLLYCYGATTQELGHPLLRRRAGDTFMVRFQFVAHFSRGHYRVNLHLRDPRDARFLMYAESVADFTIEEAVSFDGVVDIQLRADLGPASSQPAPLETHT